MVSRKVKILEADLTFGLHAPIFDVGRQECMSRPRTNTIESLGGVDYRTQPQKMKIEAEHSVAESLPSCWLGTVQTTPLVHLT